MPSEAVITPLIEGVRGLHIRADKFKTTRISLSMILPITAQTAAPMAMLARLLARSCRRYPDYTLLNRRLAELYGASLSSSVTRVGDFQVCHLTVSSIEDRYTLSGERISEACVQLLLDLVFDPNLPDGLFDQEEFESERRQLLETIRGRINDKRGYAITKMHETMCANEPYGIAEAGGEQAVTALDRQTVTAFWSRMLQTAAVQISVVGAGDPSAMFNRVNKAFAASKRQFSPLGDSIIVDKVGHPKSVETILPVAQAKLVMGFRTGMGGDGPAMIPLRVMTDIYGGAPYSRLFTVVREQMGLCYYCAARLNQQKGILYVDSGIEPANRVKAQTEIQNQLEVMQQSGFDDATLAASKMSLCDLVRGVEDTPSSLDAWYLSRVFSDQPMTPEEFIRQVQTVTKDQVVEAAQRIAFDTVYLLTGEEGSTHA